jgi:hypothetical protein
MWSGDSSVALIMLKFLLLTEPLYIQPNWPLEMFWTPHATGRPFETLL